MTVGSMMMMLQSQMNVSVVLVLFDRLEGLDFGVTTPWWAAFTGHGEAGDVELRGRRADVNASKLCDLYVANNALPINCVRERTALLVRVINPSTNQ